MKIQPAPGFDWDHISWGHPDAPASALCSYCSAGIGEDDVPLRLFADDGRAAVFCDACMAKWFGFRGL